MSEQTKKIYHRILLLLSLALLVGLGFYVHKNEQSFEKLKSIKASYIFYPDCYSYFELLSPGINP